MSPSQVVSPRAPMARYRTLFLSDLHLGMRGCQAERVLDFLHHHSAETLYLVGDVVDGWALRRSWRWTQAHNDVVQEVLRQVRGGTRGVYVPGNHDGFARHFTDVRFGGIEVRRHAVHVTADGKRLLVLHGDEFDGAIRFAPWLSRVGARAYEAALLLGRGVTAVRERLGYPYWSLAAALKARTKKAVQYIGEFERAVAHRAAEAGVDGVVCGHIHKPEIRRITAMKPGAGGSREGRRTAVLYANCGDWVENCTALAERQDGRLELIRWTDALASSRKASSGDGQVRPMRASLPELSVTPPGVPLSSLLDAADDE